MHGQLANIHYGPDTPPQKTQTLHLVPHIHLWSISAQENENENRKDLISKKVCPKLY